jgi:demethoxyubiquinone hydroxylase (CLK1/Coq7/Cat5 family)
MRDGDEPPIRGSLRLDHRGEVSATQNLTGKEKVAKICGRRSNVTEIARGEKSEELWKNIQSD